MPNTKKPIRAFGPLALLLLFCGMLGGSTSAASDEAQRQPNLLFILADDMGWRDTVVYGSRFHETPNIDRLAHQGIRFTNAYAANPLCSPTRASIQTGLYPGRLGITLPSCNEPVVRLEATLDHQPKPEQKAMQPLSVTRLKTTYPTLAKALKEAGYATGHYGKWHLGRDPYSPLEHGFDLDMPHFAGAQPPTPRGYIAPWGFSPELNFEGGPDEHLEDRMAQEAVKFIRANKDRPFYLNYWAFSPHGPWTAKPELIRKYERKADPNSPQRNPVYAAMIESFDDAVGTLLRTLDELNIADNTIVVFFSDNGHTPGLQPPPTGNFPLRGGKATLYEGGTRVPCIVRWPGRVKPDSKTEALFSSVDWYPTLLDMLGVKPKDGQRFDGISQVTAILGTGAPRDTAFCFFPHYLPLIGTVPGVWVRQGDWKLIRFFCDNPDQTDRFELYDLKTDISETKNLVTEMPAKVEELKVLIQRHLDDIHALLPKPNPAYRQTTSTATAAAPSAQTKPASAASSDSGGKDKRASVAPQTHVYKKVDNCEIRADVYRPSADSARTPVIVWIHGGALIMGSRAGINRLQLDLYLRAGYTVVAIDYRLAPEAKLPAIVEDLRDAFTWVREKGPDLLHIDPQRVAVIGHSAGGYLTQMSGWCITPRPKALVSFYGYGDIIGDWYTKPSPTYSKLPPVTREQAYACVGTTAVSEPKSDRVPFYLYARQQGIWPDLVTGLDPKKQPAAFTRFCPLQNVSADYPPILLLHGSKDSDVPYEQSVLMDAELSRFKVTHELITVVGEHGFDSDMRNPRIQKVFDRVLAFLKQHL